MIAINRNLRTRTILRAIILSLLVVSTAGAAEIAHVPGKWISIRGTIQLGDARRLGNLLLTNRQAFDDFQSGGVEISSTGGDVLEATAIASLVDAAYSRTIVPKGGECLSSCFVIWASGWERIWDPYSSNLGVHRIYLKEAELSLRQRSTKVAQASSLVDSMLRSYGIPEQIIVKMNATTQEKVFVISADFEYSEDMQMALKFRPSLYSALFQTCGRKPDFNRDLNYKSAYQIWKSCHSQIRYKNQEIDSQVIRSALLATQR